MLYCTLDENFTVFFLKHLCELRCCWLAVEGLLLIGKCGIHEEGSRMSHEKGASCTWCLKCQLVLDERERNRLVSTDEVGFSGEPGKVENSMITLSS